MDVIEAADAREPTLSRASRTAIQKLRDRETSTVVHQGGIMAVPREDRSSERVVERTSWSLGVIGPGMILGALGAAGVIISMFLPWRDGGVHPSDVPVAFLWDRDATSEPSLLILLVPLAIVLVIGTFVPMGGAVRLFGAIGTLVVAGVFAYQLDRALDAGPGADLGDALDSGFYFAAIGGILALVSGLLPGGWGTRREVVRSDISEERRPAPMDRDPVETAKPPPEGGATS